MSFTEKEIRKWHEDRAKRRGTDQVSEHGSAATCLHCGRSFGWSEGVITEVASICDICNSD